MALIPEVASGTQPSQGCVISNFTIRAKYIQQLGYGMHVEQSTKMAGLVVIATDVRIVTGCAMRLLSYNPKFGPH
jgi:hypothetical protein